MLKTDRSEELLGLSDCRAANMSKRKISGPSAFEKDRGCCGNLERLGSDLVLQIFANLQLTDLLKLRCVCKSWYHAIVSSQSIQLWKHEEEVWVLLSFRTPPDALTVSYREIWCPNSSSFKQKNFSSTIFSPPGYIGAEFEALCSSHGLVCGKRKDYSRKYVLVVGNPITNRWRQLPPVTVNIKRNKYDLDLNRFFMERDPDSGCYTVVILVRGATGFDYAWQYESKLYTWQKVGLENIRSYGIPTGDMMLLYPPEPFFELFDPFAMPHEAWQTLCMNMTHDPNVVHEHEDSDLLPLASFNYKGKHILITISVRPISSNLCAVVAAGLWELDEKNLGWKLISRNKCHAYSTLPTSWKIQLVGDIIIVSANYHFAWPNRFLPVAYDLLHSTWTTLSYSYAQGFLCYGFIPSLKAQI